ARGAGASRREVLMRALFPLVLSGCTLVVGGDPSVVGPDASASDASDASVKDASDTSHHDDEKSADVAPRPDGGCDAAGCNATKDACKKTCASTANACNAACGKDDDK